MLLHLLLARADDHRPVLSSHPDLTSVLREPRPLSMKKPGELYDAHGDVDDLRAQGWGVVAPEGARGDRLLALVSPLLRHRAEQQHLQPEALQIFRVRPDMSAADIEAFRDRLDRMPWEEQPRYLLLLGDADEVSFEVQRSLTESRFVGRLTFPREAGFEAYVDKVLRAEKEPARAALARALFFSVHDGTPATSVGYDMLMSPGLKLSLRSHQRGDFPAREVLELGTPEDWSAEQLFTHAKEPTPAVLLTLSHGLGAPRNGWPSAEEQRQRQGAMSLGRGQTLTASDVAHGPFLSDGLWFSFACFSAGTPGRSLYAPWLKRLEEASGGGNRLDALRASAPVDGRAFVAALPQVALANPEGPLGVFGHVDLAWAYAFLEPSGHGRAAPFAGVLRDLVKHHRAGVGLHVLSSVIASIDSKLARLYDGDESARFNGETPPVEELNRAHLWMTRHDLSGFVLLGDPAVRLPLTGGGRA